MAVKERKIVIKKDAKVFFRNHVDYCIGTGRMGLALTQEYQEQLKLVQDEIGFQYIRGHGLFCDDMAIYQEYEENGIKKAEYNFTYLDRVMDSYKSVGLRPFLELGFMPKKMAKGTQTIFYWEGNTTPPKDYDRWCHMVQALLKHLIERYGREEVLLWPIEVWNEPNLCGFWENADMQEYFRLFHRTFEAVKEIDERFRVGGPAVCGGTDEIWIRSFMEYCHEHKIPVDFVTRHHYTIEQPEETGHYAYSKLMQPEEGFANLKTTRDIIDSFPEYQGLPIHITEFNTSYTPRGVIHDTNLNAACTALQLSRLGDVNESYSYWTFGDVFEEMGVPFTPFYGGFGLVAAGGIPKPTFWTFVYFKKLKDSQGQCVYKDDNMVLLQSTDGNYLGVAWNIVLHSQKAADGNDTVRLQFSLPVCETEYCIMTRTVDEETCNPLKVWHDFGEPSYLKESQIKLLKEAAKPYLHTERVKTQSESLDVVLEIRKNAVVYFEINAGKVISDRGYDYAKVMEGV